MQRHHSVIGFKPFLAFTGLKQCQQPEKSRLPGMSGYMVPIRNRKGIVRRFIG